MGKHLESLQEALCYKFNNIDLLLLALTHKSLDSNNNYERLELLGDSILNYSITTTLYNTYPDTGEGDLSKMRSGLVNQDTLASIANILNLGTCLRLSSNEDRNQGRHKPSILADSLEAIFAAITIDSSLNNAINLIERLYTPYINTASSILTQNSKSRLQEYLQSRGFNPPIYTLLDVAGSDHDPIFTIDCKVNMRCDLHVAQSASTKRQASQLAAKKMLDKILQENT